MEVQSETSVGDFMRGRCMDSLPYLEVKIGVVDPPRDRIFARWPISRSARRPHAAWQSERTNKKTC